MTQQDKNLPDHEGFYWARIEKFSWYPLIIRVTGEAPFLSWTIIYDGSVFGSSPPYLSDLIWGPEIIQPEVESE